MRAGTEWSDSEECVDEEIIIFETDFYFVNFKPTIFVYLSKWNSEDKAADMCFTLKATFG